MNYFKMLLYLHYLVLATSATGYLRRRSMTGRDYYLTAPKQVKLPGQRVIGDRYYCEPCQRRMHRPTRRLRTGARAILDKMIGATARNAVSLVTGAYKTYKNLKKVKQQAGKATIDKLTEISNQVLGGAESILKGVGKFAGQVRKNANIIAQKGVSLLGKTAQMTLQVGKAIILPPLRKIEHTINLAYDVKKLGVELTKKVVEETKDWVGDGWQWVKSVEFPGKKVLVMMYPTGLISVVDYTLNTTWYLTTLAGKQVEAANAWALYAALKAVSATLGPTMKAIGMDCVLMRPRTMAIDNPMVEELRMGSGRVCGWANLVPVNNVTITSDSTTLLVINVPYNLKHLDINFKNVSVSALGDTVIDNENMHVHVKKVRAHGRISFRAGTILRFFAIHIRVDSMDGFTIDFGKQKHKSSIMELVEGMGELLSETVTKTVNEKFIKFENKLSKMILNS